MKKVVVTIDEFDKISSHLTVSDTMRAKKVFDCFMASHCEHAGRCKEFLTWWGYAALIKYGYTLGVRTERARRREAAKTSNLEQVAYSTIPMMRVREKGGAVK